MNDMPQASQQTLQPTETVDSLDNKVRFLQVSLNQDVALAFQGKQSLLYLIDGQLHLPSYL